MQSWGLGVATIGAAIGGAGAAIAAPLEHAMEVFRTTGGELAHVSAVSGVGVERLSAMSYAATQLGGSVEDLNIGMMRLGRALDTAATNGGPALEALDRIGVSLDDLSGMDQAQRFIVVGQAIGQIGDAATRDRIAMELLGRGGAQMMRMLTAGGERWNQLLDEARSRGFVMTEADVRLAGELNRAWGRMTFALNALWSKIGAAVAPAMISLLDKVVALIEIGVQWVDNNRELFVMLDKVALVCLVAGGAITGLGAALAAAGVAAAVAAQILGGVSTVISFGFTAAGFVLGIFTTLWGVLVSAMGIGASFITAVLGSAFSFLGTILGMVGGVASAVWAAFVALSAALFGTAGTSGIAAGGLSLWTFTSLAAQAATWLLNAAVTVLETLTGTILIPLALLVGTIAMLATMAASAAVALGLLLAPFLVLMALPFALLIAASAAAVLLIVRNWERIKAGAEAAWNGIRDMVGGVFGSMMDAAGSALSWIGTRFGELADTGMQMWGGLRDAFAAGDLMVGAEVLLAGLTVAWVTMIENLKTLWRSFRDWFLDLFAGISNSVIQSTIALLNQIKEALPNIPGLTAIRDAISASVTALQGAQVGGANAAQTAADNAAGQANIATAQAGLDQALVEAMLAAGAAEENQMAALNAQLPQGGGGLNSPGGTSVGTFSAAQAGAFQGSSPLVQAMQGVQAAIEQIGNDIVDAVQQNGGVAYA